MTVESSRQKKLPVFLVVGVVVVLSIAGFFRLQVDSSLEPLLPQSSQARQTLTFLRDSSFASKAILWIRLTGDGTQADLYRAAADVKSKLDPTLIKRVISPPAEANAMDEILGLVEHAGELLNQSDLDAIAPLTEPDALKKKMRENFLQLTKPQGTFMQDIIRRDPLGVNARVLARLYALSNSMGYKVEVKNGYFVHPDGRQIMLVLDTSASATSMESSHALVDHLNALAAAAPPGIKISVIAGQVHTAQNDSTMQRDMKLAGILDSVGFLLLFVLVCRDWRVAAVFMLPVIAIAVALGICALFYPHLSAMVIGLSASMAGSAVDYGIFVYTAVWMGTHPQQDMKRIRKHLLLSLLTTMGVFVAFLFSYVPAYRQLGYMTCLSLCLAMLAALYVLPLMVRAGGKVVAIGSGMPLHRWGKLMVPVLFIALIVFGVSIYIAKSVRFDADLSKLDGVSQDVRNDEAAFHKAFSRNAYDFAILVVAGKDMSDAEIENDKVLKLLSSHLKNNEIISLTNFWPSEVTRKENLDRWHAFWSPERISKLKADIAVAGAPYGFSADAFEPFFKSLTEPPKQPQSREIVASMQEQFVAHASGQTQLLSYFEDTEENVTAVRHLLKDVPNAQIISQRAMGQAFAESAISETKLLVGISLAFIIISLIAITRSAMKSILIMLPAIIGVAVMLATLSRLDLPLNVVSVIAAIMVMALCSDYGIFAVFAWDEGESMFGQGMMSMHLSSITTLIGTSSLLLAHHPALYMVGVSLTSGLLVGYLTALFVVPGICWVIRMDMTESAA